MRANGVGGENRILVLTVLFWVLLVVAISFIDRPSIAHVLSHEVGRARYYGLMGRAFTAQSTRQVQDAIHARDQALHQLDSLIVLRQHDREQFYRWYRLRRRDGEQLMVCRECLYDEQKECGYISHGQ